MRWARAFLSMDCGSEEESEEEGEFEKFHWSKRVGYLSLICVGCFKGGYVYACLMD